MYVLHALFSEAGFWELWAEDGTLIPAAGPSADPAAGARSGAASGRGRGKVPAPAARHPFAVRPDELAELLGSAGEEINDLLRRADPRGAVPVALPSTPTAPMPSSELAALLPRTRTIPLLPDGAADETGAGDETGVDGGQRPAKATKAAPTARSAKAAKKLPQLRAWIIPTLVLQPVDGAALLAALDESDRLTVLGPDGGELDLPLGASARYSRAVARFAEAVVRRGEVLPTLDVDEAEDGDDVSYANGSGNGSNSRGGIGDEDGYFAYWRPKYSYETGAYRKLLQSAMPPVFRAQLLDIELTGRASAEVLDGAICALVDSYVMEALAGPHGLHGEPLAPSNVLATGAAGLARDWLNALTSASGNGVDTSETDPETVRALAERISRWQASNLEPRTAGPVRICLRLVPPEGSREAERWTVELLLQSSTDPSLVATAAEVWQRTGAARLLKSAGVDPRTELLSGLGRAARLFPALGPALRDSAPTEVPLDLDGAYDFLRHTAPALLGSGFGVLLPAWWSARRGEVKLRLTTSEPAEQPGRVAAADSRFGFEQLVRYEWQASLGDQQLTGEEFQALAQAKSGLVQLRGQWVEVDQAGIAAGLRAMGGAPAGTTRASDVLRTALFGLDDDEHSLIEVDAAGWLGDLLNGVAEQQCTPIGAPAGMTAALRPYQERGVGWLAFMDRLGLGAVLADDMGLGKCLAGAANIFVNGALTTMEEAWKRFAGSSTPSADGLGEWAEPTSAVSVNSLSQNGSAVEAGVSRLYRQHIDEKVRRVLLEDGSEVVATLRHRFLGPGGFTNEVAVGDRIAVPARIAAGGETGTGAGAREGAAVEPDLVAELARQIAEEPAGSERVVPDFVTQADDATVALFLREYFTVRGEVIPADDAKRAVTVVAVSPEIMYQLAMMLRRFGIWLQYTEEHVFGEAMRLVGEIGGGYGDTGGSLRAFRELIGFSDETKQSELDLVCAAARESGASRVESETFPERHEPEVHYPKVIEVEELDYTGYVYDLEVPALHNYVAGGMVCHNTIQVLAVLAGERNDQPTVGPTLLICPMSLAANWQREAARFAPKLTVHIHHGSERLTGEQFRQVASESDLIVTTYALALRDQQLLSGVDWHRIVIDEAQAIKNAGTKQSRAVRSLSARHRIALTGTPVENRLADLWSVLEFANPGLLGSAERFRERFAKPIERYGDQDAAERLRRATGAFILRRVKTDTAIISDLPEKVEMKVVCNLTKEQASLYQATVDEMLREIEANEGIARRGLVLAMLTRLKQICNHPAHFLKDGSRLPGRSGKLARVEELCEEILEQGEKALLFTQYAEFGTLLQGHLATRFGREVAFLHGGVPKKARDSMVLRFEQPDGPSLFVLSLKAGGVGLNLTSANHVIHVDRWWNPAVENQATDRAFRIGQRRNVQVRKLMCAGTLEERIDQVIEEKQELAAKIVGSGESWLTELSVAELRGMIALSADAVVE